MSAESPSYTTLDYLMLHAVWLSLSSQFGPTYRWMLDYMELGLRTCTREEMARYRFIPLGSGRRYHRGLYVPRTGG